MSEIFDLYQQLILDHSRSPKNLGELRKSTHHAHGDNPHCGDSIDIHLSVKDELIHEIGFTGEGCAIFTASASLMTQKVKGMKAKDALDVFENFHLMLTQDKQPTDNLGKLAALQGVKQFPIRVKCATLCWHTLSAALTNEKTSVTTE